MTRRVADAVIIGGGVIGLGAALHLRQLGMKDVVVLERHQVGSGQSGRAAGIVRSLVASAAVSKILLESIAFFKSLEERFGEELRINQSGYLLLCDAGETENLDRVISTARTAGCNAARISGAEAVELQPGLRCGPDDLYAFEPEAIHVDPMYATQALARAARRSGVEILEGCEVLDIRAECSRVRGVEAAAGPISAPNVLVSTAAWGAAQLARVGIQVPVYPHRVEMAFFVVPARSPLRLRRILSDAKTMLYLRPEGEEQMFVGWREGDRIFSPDDLRPVDPDNYRQTSHYETLREMHRRLAITLPFMAEGFAHRTYACVYDYTPDGMPVLDEADSARGLYFALGFSGGGFSLSPWVGRVMARFIAGESKPPEMQLLRANRFAENAPVSWSNASGRSISGNDRQT